MNVHSVTIAPTMPPLPVVLVLPQPPPSGSNPPPGRDQGDEERSDPDGSLGPSDSDLDDWLEKNDKSKHEPLRK